VTQAGEGCEDARNRWLDLGTLPEAPGERSSGRLACISAAKTIPVRSRSLVGKAGFWPFPASTMSDASSCSCAGSGTTPARARWYSGRSQRTRPRFSSAARSAFKLTSLARIACLVWSQNGTDGGSFGNQITLGNVQFAHSAGALAQTGLLITEDRNSRQEPDCHRLAAPTRHHCCRNRG
jgi:hypothetical protein